MEKSTTNNLLKSFSLEKTKSNQMQADSNKASKMFPPINSYKTKIMAKAGSKRMSLYKSWVSPKSIISITSAKPMHKYSIS